MYLIRGLPGLPNVQDAWLKWYMWYSWNVCHNPTDIIIKLRGLKAKIGVKRLVSQDKTDGIYTLIFTENRTYQA